MTAALELKGVKKAYRQGDNRLEVLRDVNLAIQAGEVIALVAPSGAGKTTLLQIAGLLDRPDTGEVWLGGDAVGKLDDASRSRKRRGSVGFILQFHHLLPEFTALENVMMPVLLAGTAVAEASSRATALLEAVGLGHRLDHKPGELSGGERQRAAVARALVNHPACVLGDEPTGNLDDRTAGTVFDLMLELNRARHTSLVLVTHDRSLARRLDRVLELREGRLHALAHADV